MISLIETPRRAKSLHNSRTPPGRSLSSTVNRKRRPSEAKPRSRQRPKVVVSILPPQIRMTTLKWIFSCKTFCHTAVMCKSSCIWYQSLKAVSNINVYRVGLFIAHHRRLSEYQNILETHFFPLYSSSCPDIIAARPKIEGIFLLCFKSIKKDLTCSTSPFHHTFFQLN